MTDNNNIVKQLRVIFSLVLCLIYLIFFLVTSSDNVRFYNENITIMQKVTTCTLYKNKEAR